MPDSPFDFSKAHELETVELRLLEAHPARVVADRLSTLGLVAEDEFCRLPREDRPQPWQSSDICHVSFFVGGNDVRNLEEDECNLLRFEYLFASLPADLQDRFLHTVEAAHALLGGMLEHRGESVDRAQLRAAFDRYAADIRDEFAYEPGTDGLARLIYEFAPRG